MAGSGLAGTSSQESTSIQRRPWRLIWIVFDQFRDFRKRLRPRRYMASVVTEHAAAGRTVLFAARVIRITRQRSRTGCLPGVPPLGCPSHVLTGLLLRRRGGR